jgi:hypothetical protein
VKNEPNKQGYHKQGGGGDWGGGVVEFLQSKERKRDRTYFGYDYPMEVGDCEKENDGVRKEMA